MNNNLILEINRVKSLMGLSDGNFINDLQILNESVASKLRNYLMVIDNLDDASKIEDVLKKMKGLAGKKFKITPEAIKTLADDIFREKKAIASAARKNALGTLGKNNKAYAGLEEFKRNIEISKGNIPIDNDAKFIEIINNAHLPVFDNVNGLVYKSYFDSWAKITDEIAEESGSLNLLNKSLYKDLFFEEFIRQLELKGIKYLADDKYFKPLKNWFDKKFKEAVEQWKVNKNVSFDDKPIVDLANIKKVSRNWRFIRNLIKKFEGIFKKVNYADSLKENLAVLKNFPKEKIIVNGRPSEEFQNLTRAIAYDIDQLDNLEKDAKKMWDEILNDSEIDDELKAAIKKSEIYGGVYKTETINDYLDELAKRYPDVKPSNWEQFKSFFGKFSDWSEKIAKAKELAFGGVDAWYKELFFWAGKFLKFIWQNIKASLRLIFTGQYKSFRTLQKMFSRKGFGNSSRLASNFVFQYAKLLLYKQVLIIFPIIFNNILANVLESRGINVVEGEGSLKDRIYNDFMDELTTLSGSDFFPFDFSVSIEMASDFKNFIFNLSKEDPNKVENELIMSKNEAFNQWYNSLKKEDKQNLIKGLGESQNIGTAFGKLYLWTSETWTFNKKQFIEKNNLKDDDIKKIKNSLVAYSNLNVDAESFKEQVDEWKKIVISPEQIKQAFSNDKNIKKASSLADATLGAVRTADGSLYEPINSDDIHKFNFKKISYKPYYSVVTITPKTASEQIKYRIYYAKDRDEIPTEADLNDIKSINPKGLASDGFFYDPLDAEKAVMGLNKKQKIIQDENPINLQELLKKL